MREYRVHCTAHNVGYTILTPAGHRRLHSQVDTGFLCVCVHVSAGLYIGDRGQVLNMQKLQSV